MGDVRERDYTSNRRAASHLAHKIQSFWRLKGYPQIDVWVEEIPEYPGWWQIRSNIKFGSVA